MSKTGTLDELVDIVLATPMRGLQIDRHGIPVAMLISMEAWNAIRGTGLVSWWPDENPFDGRPAQ